MNSNINKLLNEVFDKTWERLENLNNEIGYEEAYDSFVRFFDDETVNQVIDFIANEFGVVIDDKENNLSSNDMEDKNFQDFGNLGKAGLNENESNLQKIVGKDILNHFPFSALPEERIGADWINGVEGWGKVQLPSVDESDSVTQIVSKSDFFPREVQGPKMLHKFSGYLDEFERRFGEEPIFVIDPSQPWFGKVKIINPKFNEWKERGLKVKGDTLARWGSTNEERKLRKTIQNLFETYWSDKDWGEFLNKDTSIQKSKLKSEIESYISSDRFSNRDSVEDVMDIAKRTNPGVNEYDLIDAIKASLVEIERDNDEIDSTIRNRANKIYDEIDRTFQMVNELEVVSGPGKGYFDYAGQEREYWDRHYYETELKDELEAAKKEIEDENEN
jgi:hypothetical protein